MTNFARIINNVAVDVCQSPEDCFHPDIASQFVSVPDSVVQGSTRDATGVWHNPVVPEPVPAPVVYPQVSPVEFKLLFTSPERVAIKAAVSTDAVIEDFWSIVEDTRLTYVDLGLQSTQDCLAYMVIKSFITEERKAEILTGVVK